MSMQVDYSLCVCISGRVRLHHLTQRLVKGVRRRWKHKESANGDVGTGGLVPRWQKGI